MNQYRGAIVTTWRYKEYVAVFRKGNKTARCFKYTNTRGRRASMIKDPINWAEDCEPVTVPRGADFKNIYLNRYDKITLWDAMNLLENHIKENGW